MRRRAPRSGPKELDALTEQFRTRACERWLPLLNGNTLGSAAAAALVWTLVTALLTLGDQVAHGEIDRAPAAPEISERTSGAAGAPTLPVPRPCG